MILVAMYLSAIVIANLLVAQFGAQISIINAFLFIGLDLSTRDSLHEKWQGKNLIRNMLILIASGSILSALFNWQASMIALASFSAFAVAGLGDTIAYQLLGDKSRLIKMNGSNLVSAALDSLVFPAIAFGLPLLWTIVIGQFIAKVLGGFLWSLVLNKWIK